MAEPQPISEPAGQLDPAAWPDRYGDTLYRYAVLRLGDAAAAEDAVQETFLAGLQAAGGFKGRSTELTWLTGILKHKIIDQLRKGGRESTVDPTDRLLEMSFDERGHWKIGPQKWGEPNQALENEQFLTALERCIKKLPQKLAQVFTLTEFDGAGSRDVCAVLDITDSNLWVRLHRARLRLRECLEINWFGK